MGVKLTKLPKLNTSELTDGEALLLQLVRERDERIQELTDEVARLKGEKGKPKLKPSRLEPKQKAPQAKEDAQELCAQENSDSQKKKKRPGSAKRKKTAELPIHETQVIQPIEEIPPGSELRGYQDYTVQELIVRPHNILYRLACWKTPTGEYLRGKLPKTVLMMGHFGSTLKSYLLYQYHHCHVTQPKLRQQMEEWGIELSSGQLNRILVEDKEKYHSEKQELLRVGLSVSSYINTDDTGARHEGVNSYCTHIGNEWFAWFETTPRKNRINFLELLRGETTDYVLSSEALTYMAKQKLPKHLCAPLSLSINRVFKNKEEWLSYLKHLGIEKPRHVKTATEGALLGAVISSGVSPHLGIMSDGAGQFRLLEHGLCWVHAERLINKLIPLTQAQRQAVSKVQDEIWDLYQNLKIYQTLSPQQQQQQKASWEKRFEQIFTQTTLFETLNQVLRRLNRRKRELLKVLERPDLPLHNNASEQDIREFVTKRKISGSTRSDSGRRCRDTFASLKKTCRKLGVSFWEYLTDRVSGKNSIPTLGELIVQKAMESQGTLAETISLSSA
ncbi:MAG: transposase [Symploca sp. SIO3E6]|nr:transposase [Caldora sp. SIO3E6]